MTKLALIGYGYWGKNYVKTIASLKDLQLVSVFSPNSNANPDDLPAGCVFTHECDDIFKNNDIQGVIIATPPGTHFEFAKKAMLSGKDVLVEKPITIDPLEAKELQKLAQCEGRILMVGHIFMFHRAIEELKRIIDSGVLGNIRYLTMRRSGPGPVRTDISAMWNLAPHDISISNYLIGELPTQVEAFQASSGKEDAFQFGLEYPGGTKTFVYGSWSEPKKVREFIVVGDKKTAIFDDLLDSKLVISDNANGDTAQPKMESGSPLELECLHFADCIINQRTPRVSGNDGYVNTVILSAADKSISIGKKVDIQY